MEITMSGTFKNIKIEITGASSQEVAREFKALLEEVGGSISQLEPESVPVGRATPIVPPPTPDTDSSFEGLVRFTDKEPVLLKPLHNVIEQDSSRRAQQMSAFVVLSYALTKKGVTEQTSNMVSNLMTKSGFDVERIDSAIGGLADDGHISKAKGEKTFTLTPKGEAQAEEMLRKAKGQLMANKGNVSE
jgi:predicted transcriptional regulator